MRLVGLNNIFFRYMTKQLHSLTEFANKLYEFSDHGLGSIPEPKDLISFARQIAVGMVRKYLLNMSKTNIVIFHLEVYVFF